MNPLSVSLPVMQLVAGSACISFAPILVRVADVNPDVAGFYRMFFAFCGLLILVLVRREWPRPDGRSFLLLLLCGVWLACDFMAWHRSIALIGPGFSTLLGNFQVFFTVFLSWLLFRERIRSHFILAVLLGFAGLLLMTGIDLAGLPPGVRTGMLLGFVTALFYSFYILTLKRAMACQQLGGASAMLIISVSCVVVLGLVIRGAGVSFAVVEPRSWLALAGVGILGSTIGWSLLSAALKVVPASVAGLTMLLQPALSFLWDVLMFDRPTSWFEYAGLLMILSAIYLGSFRPSRS